MARYLLILPIILILYLSVKEDNQVISVEKIEGVSLVAPRNESANERYPDISALGATWVAVIPFGFIADSTGIIHFNNNRQWWGETKEGVEKSIEQAHQHGLKVMLKPHIWIRGMGWPGEYLPDNETAWSNWERTYSEYILLHATIAEKMQSEMFCIGTEFRLIATERPEYWRKLITKVRTIYKGKLTYAANWDNFENILFWDQLDYIGVDAYFPLSKDKEPTVKAMNKGWKKPLNDLREISSSFNKPILFTEYGYQSKDFTAAGHWNNDDESAAVNYNGQSNAYQSLFESVWKEPWMAGGFLWKWHMETNDRFNQHIEKEYSPQGKPAEKIIQEFYLNHSAKLLPD